jgi:signal transduction histidine kinase
MLTEKLATYRLNRESFYNIYLWTISASGFALVLWALTQIPSYPSLTNFLLLVLLSALAAQATTSITVGKNAGITYHVGSAIGLATLPLLGISSYILLLAAYNFFMWLFKPRDAITWKKSWSQLAFNIGMHAIAAVVSGWGFRLTVYLLGENTWAGMLLPWPVAAILLDEVNLWLLIGILSLQNGPSFRALSMWREERWASQISTAVLMLGGGILSIAIERYDWVGIIIFYLPTALSAYAFRLYVTQMQLQMDNLEKIVKERTHDLEEVNRQKDAFLAVLTHDMMTPLTSIQLCAEELQDDPMAATYNPYLAKVMVRSQKTLFNLVRNILDLEKLRSGRSISLQRTTCDMVQLATGMMEIVQPEAQAKNITFTHYASEEPLLMDVDRQHMERVILNLISNAVKYTPSGGSIHVDMTRDDQEILLKVVDTGYGIPVDELPFIFERFRRVEQLKDKAVGTGLGLAITKALVEEHGGKILVESAEGKGSTFAVHLPLQ